MRLLSKHFFYYRAYSSQFYIGRLVYFNLYLKEDAFERCHISLRSTIYLPKSLLLEDGISRTLNDLEPETEYEILVSSFNLYGNGQPGLTRQRTAAEGKIY